MAEEKSPALLGTELQAMMTEIMAPVARALQQNAEALDRLAAAQTVQNNRLEALEKQFRLQTPVTAKQAQYLNRAMKDRARDILDKRGLSDDPKAVKKLAAAIRRDVLVRYGTGTVREIPRHEYPVAMNQVNMWSNALLIRDAVAEARERMDGGGDE